MSLRKVMPLLAAIMFGLLAIVAALALGVQHAAERRDEALAWQEHTVKVLGAAGALSDAMRDQEIGQRGFLLTLDPAYRTLATTGQNRAEAEIAVLRALTRDNPVQQRSLAALSRLASARGAQTGRTLALAADGRLADALAVVRTGAGMRTMFTYRAGIARVVASERHLLAERGARVAEVERRLKRRLIVLALFGAAILTAALAGLGLALLGLNRARFRAVEQVADRKVRLSEERLRVMQAAGEVGGFDIDLSTGQAVCSPELFAMLDLPPLPVMRAEDVEPRLHDDDRAVLRAVAAAAIADGLPLDQEVRIVRGDGTARWLALRGRAITETEAGPDAGRATRYAGVVLDVTARKAQEAELEAARATADAANQAKSQFLANMSHELRTPLNAVIGYSEMLREDAEDAGAGALIADLDKINRAGKTLLALVNDVLDLSKIEAGKMDVYLEDVDLTAFVTDVIGTAQPLMARNNNRLEAEAPAGLPTVRVDLTKVRQILLNLLSNAAKFTSDGTVTLAVSPSAAADGDRVRFSVADQGIGMTPEQLGRLFTAFEQADASTTRNYGGTGLGLALTKTLCELMGGTIKVESEPGRGTRFTVDLPANRSHPATAPDGDVVAPTAGAEVAGAAGGGRLVLVIDDDPQVHELMGRLLAREGLDMAVAADGESGLAQARALRPAAITLDVTMPRMDGWHVLARLKNDPATSAIPVVMLTMVQDRTIAYALGASDYLSKPVNRDRLHEVLERHVGRRDGTVMVVEDDPATRELIRRTLDARGHPVVEAGNGREALERLSAAGPDLVLMDLTMPEMDGFEFLHRLRQQPRWRDVPVIVMTSKDLSAEERQLLAGQVDGVVQKGAISRDDLARQIADRIAAAAPPPVAPSGDVSPAPAVEA